MAQTLTALGAIVRPCDGCVSVRLGSVVLAVSEEAWTIHTHRGHETVVLPLKDVFLSYFTVSERLEHEPGIGTWRACDLASSRKLDGRTLPSVMWTLVDSTAATQAVFFHARFDTHRLHLEQRN